MNNIIAIIVASAVLNSKNVVKEVDSFSNSNKDQVKEDNTTQVFKVGYTIKTKRFKIRVNKVSKSNYVDFIKPKSGNEFIKVSITIENISKEEQLVSTVMMFIVVVKDWRELNKVFTENQNGKLDDKVAPEN